VALVIPGSFKLWYYHRNAMQYISDNPSRRYWYPQHECTSKRAGVSVCFNFNGY
jgi:hypothetical protein